MTSGGNLGFSLVELLVVMLISGVVMAAIYNIYTSQQNAYTSQEYVAEAQQNFRAAITIMGREIRLTGHRDPLVVAADPSTSTDCLVAPGVCIGSNASQLVFTYFDTAATDNAADYDGDGILHGAPDADELVRVVYDLYAAFDDGVAPADPVDDLGRAVGAGNRVPTVLNIHGLEFRYLIDNGAGGFNLAAVVDAVNMRNVRGVEVTILAKSGGVDRNYMESPTFASPGGVNWTLPTGVRGRMFTTAIMCRNLSL
ncbi:MAG: prepilin-type N-terminal cleavage/methylation domain-containing protein [Proteobacteria bacterium]|nr:prepilin-type N-terminal cleavage/methylation domain-containing protein [Pseudomonadota bacterium]MBU4117685.1 prepilin-type N-terminal cleavage/methylation domain-containing protein [Pseudomonadota bacterium]